MARELTPEAAFEAVTEHMGGPFEWGRADCCSGPCNAFRALTGVDALGRLRGAYDGQAGAMRQIRLAGGLWRLARELAGEAGLEAVAPEAAPVGAIGLVRNGFGHSLALCIGAGTWAAKSKTGFVIVTKAEAAWRA